MKTDILTTAIAAIAGVVISYFIMSSLILKDPAPVVVKTLSTTNSTDLDEPNVEIFNYRAINPTVEAYVDCTNYDYAGNCIEGTGE